MEFFQFEIIINVFVSSMLWVYSHYKYSNSWSASRDVRFWRLKSVLMLSGLKSILNISKFDIMYCIICIPELIIEAQIYTDIVHQYPYFDSGI